MFMDIEFILYLYYTDKCMLYYNNMITYFVLRITFCTFYYL